MGVGTALRRSRSTGWAVMLLMPKFPSVEETMIVVEIGAHPVTRVIET